MLLILFQKENPFCEQYTQDNQEHAQPVERVAVERVAMWLCGGLLNACRKFPSLRYNLTPVALSSQAEQNVADFCPVLCAQPPKIGHGHFLLSDSKRYLSHDELLAIFKSLSNVAAKLNDSHSASDLPRLPSRGAASSLRVLIVL